MASRERGVGGGEVELILHSLTWGGPGYQHTRHATGQRRATSLGNRMDGVCSRGEMLTGLRLACDPARRVGSSWAEDGGWMGRAA